MAGATIEFYFESPADEASFCRSYLVEAWDRFRARDFWETGWFWTYGQFAEFESGPDGGLVRLVFEGNPDALVAAESSRWDRCDALLEWTVHRYEESGYDDLLSQQLDAKGAVGGRREYRLKPLVAAFSLAYREAFEERVPPVADRSEQNRPGIGFWAVVHDMLVQCGYDWYDETAICQKALRNRLKSIASYRGAEAAREEYQRLLDEWQAFESELDDWLEANPTGTASEP